MKTVPQICTAMRLLTKSIFVQAPPGILMDPEPDLHLTLQEGYLNVLKVEIPPGDSIVLQSRDQVTVAIGEQLVTLGIPSKLDIHQKNQDARLSLLLGRHVRSARAGGDTSYHTLTVEALPPDRFSERLLGRHPGRPLPADDFVWLARGGISRIFRNNGQAEARFVWFTFNPG